MKKYLVIGNPIKHSLSPQLHNYWIKKNNIDAVYEREKLNCKRPKCKGIVQKKTISNRSTFFCNTCQK